MAGVTYGLFLGMLVVALGTIAPQPTGSIVLCMLLAIDLGFGATLLWRRTGMWLSAISWMISAVWFASVGFVVLVQHSDVHHALDATPWLYLVPIITVPSIFVEQRVHAETWQRWTDHMKRCSFGDMLLFRHIPDLHAH